MPTDPIDDQVWRDLANRNHGMAIYPPRTTPNRITDAEAEEIKARWLTHGRHQRPEVLDPLPVRRLSWWRRLRLRWGR